MGRAATGTGPQPITQGDGMVDEATDIAAFGGWEAAPLSWGRSAVADAGNKAVDVIDMGAVLFGSLVQNLHKPAKAQIRHFTAPQRLHAVQLQVFQEDRVVRGTQFMGEVPLPRLALMGALVPFRVT